MTHKRVLVAGATGRLGVIVGVLLDRGHSVRAMTRDPTSSAAARLRVAGAEVVYGDFDDPDSVEGAAAGVDAMFATGTAHRAGSDGECATDATSPTLRQRPVFRTSSTALATAAADSPLPLFRVKHQVEQYIRSLPIAETILAPVYFMENLFNPWNLAALQAGVLPSPIDVDLPLQQVAIADLAGIVAIAIERPAEFAGRRIRVASDELTATDAADALTRLTGRPFSAQRVATSELGPGLRSLFAWLEQSGHDVDIPRLHGRYPRVRWHTYEEWLRSQRSRLAALCPQEHATAN